MQIKECKKCLESKPLDSYHKNKRHKFGVSNVCKTCRKELAATNYTARWFKMTCTLKKSWCKKRGIPFDLDREYLESIWTTHCPVFNRPFVRHKKGDDFCPALDRVDPKGGYTKGNVKYISARANRIKYDASVEELKKVLAYVEGATTIESTS